jgi:hypothetical protein
LDSFGRGLRGSPISGVVPVGFTWGAGYESSMWRLQTLEVESVHYSPHGNLALNTT